MLSMHDNEQYFFGALKAGASGYVLKSVADEDLVGACRAAMTFYQRRGRVSPQRHTQHRDADGRLLFEELMGEEGFSADASLLYHRHIPSALVDARPWRLPDQTTVANEPLLPRHLALHTLFAAPTGDVVTGPAIVVEMDSTALVLPGHAATVHSSGALLIEPVKE